MAVGKEWYTEMDFDEKTNKLVFPIEEGGTVAFDPVYTTTGFTTIGDPNEARIAELEKQVKHLQKYVLELIDIVEAKRHG